MKAIRVRNFGREGVLQIEDIEIPQISSFKILIKVEAAGINPVDTYIREGAFLNLPELPYTPGKDGAGIVQEIGESVTKFKVGDRVFFCGRNLGSHGSYAEYCVTDEKDTFPLSDSLSFEEGAALGIPYFTAFRALVIKAQWEPNQIVLVHGASGGVGIAAIQLAKSRGLKVIGTAGTAEGINLIKQNGCDFAFCHRDKNYIQQIQEALDGQGVDVIIEMLANVNLKKDLELLASRGKILVVGSRGATSIDPRVMMMPETTISGVALLNSTDKEWEATAEGILEDIKKGKLKPVIDKVYSLKDAPAAHRDIIHSSGAKGKLILLPFK